MVVAWQFGNSQTVKLAERTVRSARPQTIQLLSCQTARKCGRNSPAVRATTNELSAKHYCSRPPFYFHASGNRVRGKTDRASSSISIHASGV